jgi:amino acid transporter/nucleotide-binding universal stress UspA family protein
MAATQSTATDSHVETELSRDLGLVSALAIGVGTMIAAGIFTLSGLAVGYVGSAAIVSFLLAAVVATFTALTYCEFTSIYPQTGEGYLYARRTFSPLAAYLVGLCLLLGYISSCAFYIASLSSYWNEFIWHLPIEALSGLVFLGILTLLNIKGTKETGSFQVIVTTAKVVLLLWFVTGGISAVHSEELLEKFSRDIPTIASTAALVFITFFGFSAIAASAGEVKNPTRTIPRAIFISMGVVTVLYSLVVLVVVAADLSEYDEAAMGRAAKDFLGPIGGMVIVLGALFSMVSASNASIMAGSRVALSMSRLGHLPRGLGVINRQTRTPIVALLLVGMGVGGFATILPLEGLAHFADTVLLVALTFVNVALIYHRRKYPNIERPFRVPLVPLLPILGVLANLYLLVQIPLQGHVVPFGLAGLALLGGIAGYLAWKGSQVELAALPGQPSHVALEQKTAAEARFRVLVPIANPANVRPLIDLASALAKPRQGEIVTLRVALVPEQVAPTVQDDIVEKERVVLDQARAHVLAHELPNSSILRFGHSAARAILETARDHACKLIVLGWKGHTSTARRILGEVTDDVITHARNDIVMVKIVPDYRPFKRLLVSSAGGEHAVRAVRYAGDIARANDGSVTLCRVISPLATDDEAAEEKERLLADQADILGDVEMDTAVIRHPSIATGIVELAKDYDAVILGATGKSFSNRVLFGSIPEDVAYRADCPVIVVKRYHPVKALLGRVMTD